MAPMAENTGGMIALVPSDWRPLAITDGEPGEELHLTLLYLGDDVSTWAPEQRDAAREIASGMADLQNPLQARLFGHARFNPDGGPDGDREPCLVYLVGDAPGLVELRRFALDRLRQEIGEAMVPEQHEPFVPHITAAYGRNPEYGLFTTGPVVFDRVRLALGGEVTDYPMGDAQVAGDTGEEAEVDGWFQQKVMSPSPGAARLREYWAHGPGRRKWRKWRQLRRQLAKYVKNPHILDGLTTNIYRMATGHMPPHGGQRKDGTAVLSEAEVKAALALADPDAEDFDPDLLAGLWDGDEDDPDEEDDPDDADALFEQALADDVDWGIDADAMLVPDDEEEDGEDEEPAGPRTPSSMAPSLFEMFPEN